MKRKPKQIAAIICIILLVLLYVAALVVSLFGLPWFRQALCRLSDCYCRTSHFTLDLYLALWKVDTALHYRRNLS